MIKEDGYVIIRNAISKEIASFVAKELSIVYEDLKDNQEYRTDDIEGAFSIYGLPPTETLMLNLWNTVEKEVGVELLPTYSYARYYELGQEMHKHTDRPSSEYAITANLWNEKDPWPIWFLHPKGHSVPITLYPGDIIIYKGSDIPHWREVNTFGKVIQTFLFYIDINGSQSHWAYDKRELGETYNRKNNVF